MIYDLSINLFIIIAMLLFAAQLFKTKALNVNSPLNIKIGIGVLSGLSGVFLIIYPVKIINIVYIDLRYLAITISALYGGLTSSLICASIIIVFRIIIGGINIASILSIFDGLAIALFCGYISIKQLSWLKKYIIMNGFNLLTITLFLYNLLGTDPSFKSSLYYFYLISIITIIFVYFFLAYIKNSYKAYNEMYYYKIMADNMVDLVSTHSPTGVYLYASCSSETILGYTPEELTGMNAYDLFHPEDLKKIEKFHLSLLNSPTNGSITYRIRQKTGTYIWFETRQKNILDKDGNVIELICVSRDVTSRKKIEDHLLQVNEQLKIFSYIDALTGVANRRNFNDTIEKEWNNAIESLNPLSLLILDIDYFKIYNDTYGHLQGDECLKSVANTLKESVKEPTSLISRYGGEEFAVILPNTDSYKAYEIAERLRLSIEALNLPHINSKLEPIVTISIGVNTIIPKKDLSYVSFIYDTDMALYQSKENGRNRIVVCQSY